MDWETVSALGAMIIAAVALLSRSFDKSLSIREHEEFRGKVNDQFRQNRDDVNRQLDQIRENVNRQIDQALTTADREHTALLERIKVLEQTRPTTGELQAYFTNPINKNNN